MSSSHPPHRFLPVFLSLLCAGTVVWFWVRPSHWSSESAAIAKETRVTPAAATRTGAVEADASAVAPAHRASRALIRWWSAPREVRGEPLAPNSPRVFAARARGETVAGRTALFAREPRSSLAVTEVGDQIAFTLPDGAELLGRVNLIVPDVAGPVRVAGVIESRAGSFSLAQNGPALSGTIYFKNDNLALEITSDASGGEVQLVERLLSDLLCLPFPSEPEFRQAATISGPPAAPPLLSSRPGAQAVLYLDFDGETVVDPDWNSGNPIFAAAPNLAPSQIMEIWHHVKEDFWPFNIDVTTDVDRYNNAPVGRRMRCIITPTSSWFGAAGGVAWVNSFNRAGTTRSATIPCWVFNSSVKGIAEAVSHELGHTLGLSHDGRSSPAEAYYLGHGGGAVGWAPIMGAGYYQPITQWSKGEYASANNLEDDVALIARTTNGFGSVTDDVGDSRASALALAFTGSSLTRAGAIGSASDVDYYAFTPGGKGVTLTISPAAIAPNLDLAVELQDGGGAVLATHNPEFALHAELTTAATAGTLYLKIQGAGRGNASFDGYSRYGSLGAYTITATLSDPPSILTHPAGQTAEVGGATTFSVAATGSGVLTYQWRKNGAPLADSATIAGATTSKLTLSNVQFADAGTYSVIVSSAFGVATSNDATFAVIGPPSFQVAPLSRVAVVGQATTFAASALSSEPFTYQWRRNGQTIAGASTATLGIPTASLADRGWYEVLATNTRGTTRRRFHFDVVPGNCAVLAWGNNTSGQASVPAGLINIVAVETGGEHSLALRADGTVVGWGQNTWGQTNVPAGLRDVVAISAGASHSLALRADGTVVEWGTNFYGYAPKPSNLRDVVMISAGEHHALALKSDGALVAWGRTDSNRISIPSNLGEVTAIAAGSSHNVALRADGTLLAWGGDNIHGERTLPASLANIIGISARGSHTLALGSDGRVHAWGLNDRGQCNVPSGIGAVTHVSAGFSHSAAVKADGSAATWGSTEFGVVPPPAEAGKVFGLSARSSHCLALTPLLPVTIAMQPVGTALTAGDDVVLEVRANGTRPFTYQWKRNNVALANGGRISGADSARLVISGAQLADAGEYVVLITNAAGNITSAPAILVVAAPPVVTARPRTRIVTAGEAVSFNIEASGTGLTYQWKHQGQVVAGATSATLTLPVVLPEDSGWYHVTVTGANGGQATALAYLRVNAFQIGDTTVAAWGENISGQRNVPPGLTQVVAIAAGEKNSLALRSDGTVIEWGNANRYDYVGALPDLRDVVALAAGDLHSLALKSDGTVIGWGENTLGQITIPLGLRNVVSIAAGSRTSAAVKADGTVVAWGENDGGQTAVPPALANAMQVAVGSQHIVALRSDGSVSAWGANSSRQIDLPSPLPPIAGVSAGRFHTLAVGRDGAVFAWGNNFVGQSNVPAGLSNIVAVAGGGYFSMALNASGGVTVWGENHQGQMDVAGALQGVLAIAGGAGHGLAIVSRPRIMSPPQPLTLDVGQTATFSVAAAGSGPLAYQWRKDGANLAQGTSATLTIPNVQPAHAGNYSVTVVNQYGSSTSANAAVHVLTNGPLANHAVAAAGYTSGSSVSITNTLYASGTLSSFDWDVLLPDGWTFATSTGDAGSQKPVLGNAGLLTWRWTTVPASPVTFSYSVNVPAGQTGDKHVVSNVVVRRGTAPTTLLGQPDPLIVRHITHHDADTTRDFRINLVELTRMIELYNTRNGSTRTGSYAVATTASEDGFAPDPARSAAATGVLVRYHSADTNRDGKLNLIELTRVIELYNFRSGSTRTGSYKAASGTEDGFAPGN